MQALSIKVLISFINAKLRDTHPGVCMYSIADLERKNKTCVLVAADYTDSIDKREVKHMLLDRLMDISQIYTQTCLVFPHFHRCGIDWNDTYRHFLERALRTKSDLEHALLMSEFINTLGDGHTDLSISRDIRDPAGYLPFSFFYAGGNYYWERERILAVDQRPIEALIQEIRRYCYHVGNFVPRLEYFLPLILREGPHELNTVSGSHAFSMVPCPPKPASQDAPLFSHHGDILVIRLDDFLRDRTPEIRAELEHTKPRSVILDVRHNIGGMTQYAANVAQLFIPGTFGGCQKWTRTMTGIDYASASQICRMSLSQLQAMDPASTQDEWERSRRVWNLTAFKEYQDNWGAGGTPAVFSGKMAVLTSRNTVSAAEDFTAFFRTNHQATLIGSPTCGTSGTPLLYKLSCGTLRVCSVGYRLLDGTEWLGSGITPDLLIEPQAEDIRLQRDVVLEYALAYLK